MLTVDLCDIKTAKEVLLGLKIEIELSSDVQIQDPSGADPAQNLTGFKGVCKKF